VRVTIDNRDSIHRRAKAKAAERQIPLRQFITEAVAEKLESKPSDSKSERMNWAGQLRHLRRETACINAVIEEEFERIDPEE